MTKANYSKIENGKRYYTFEQMQKISIALDTSMDYLAGLTDEIKPYKRKKVGTQVPTFLILNIFKHFIHLIFKGRVV